MRFVIVSGMSGAGKSVALNMLEDIGFHCIDNFPVKILSDFMRIGSEIDNDVAVVVDIRSGAHLEDLSGQLDAIGAMGIDYEILFLDADDRTLIKRYKETRRPHPLAREGRIEHGIAKERKLISFIKERADYIIDTTSLLTRELKQEVEKIFVGEDGYSNFIVTILSFGFKYGIPVDSDLVFDVRFLPNPYYDPELRPYTGNDEPVRRFVMDCEEAHTFLDKLEDMVDFLIPHYRQEGKYRLVISIGCTGGRHRSVAIANALHQRMQRSKCSVRIEHRDIPKDIVTKEM